MTNLNVQSYLLPILLIGFFGYRFYKFKRAKKEIPKLMSVGGILIDVRTVAEFKAGHNPQSINIPLNELESKAGSLDKSLPIILCCASGARSSMAVGIMKKKGFSRVINAGTWGNTV